MDIQSIKQHINEKNFEISGKYERGVFYMINEGPPITKGNRGSVMIDYNPIVWHTHPSIAKYYPSVEDVCKVLKKHNGIETYVSIIFTVHGVWVLSNFVKPPPDPDADSLLREAIEDEINSHFYENTNEGKDYNAEAIKTYLKNIKTLMNGWSYDFDIHFFRNDDELLSFLSTSERQLIERLPLLPLLHKGGKKQKNTKNKKKYYKKTKKYYKKTKKHYKK